MDKICRKKSSGYLRQKENKIGNNFWLSVLQFSITLIGFVCWICDSVFILFI